MRYHVMMGCAGLVLFGWMSASSAMMAAPDPTPLLFDRVKTFDAVVVATVPDGFEKQARPLKNTNAVAMPIRIERVLRGSLKPGEFFLQVHQSLPAELAQREKRFAVKLPDYLLAVQINKVSGHGYLGAGQLGQDLARFIPVDPSVEKVVAAFMAAADQQPKTILAMCSALLDDEKLSAVAADQVLALAARSVREWVANGPDERAARLKVVTQIAPAVLNRGKRGECPAAVARFADAAIDCGLAQQKILDPNVIPPLRKVLADALAAAKARAINFPDYDDISAAASALGRLDDKDSAPTIVALMKEPWTRRIAPNLRGALVLMLGESEAEKLAPADQPEPLDGLVPR